MCELMSAKKIVIAIDAMGGDKIPNVPIEGIKLFCKKYGENGVFFKVFGDEKILSRSLMGLNKSVYEIIHSESAISSDEKPSIAIRKSKGTSMRMAIEAVASGVADASISGGNTGALMALSKLILKTTEGINRPAICALMPTKKGKCVLLDMGANIEVSARNLLEFAIMGSAFAEVVLKKRNPKIALLNIGSEEMKGHDYIHEAAELIRNSHIADQFHGYIEPDKIYAGDIDVIATDGFTGNVVIKSAEGLGKLIKSLLKDAFSSNIVSMLGYGISSFSLNNTMQIMDPNNYNGGMFIGLNGVSLKSHGGADKFGFCNAIGHAVSIVKNDMNKKITARMIKNIDTSLPPSEEVESLSAE